MIIWLLKSVIFFVHVLMLCDKKQTKSVCNHWTEWLIEAACVYVINYVAVGILAN